MSRTCRGAAVLVVALLAVVLTLTGLPSVAPVAPAGASVHEDGLPVLVEVTRVTPQVLRPGEDLVVTATVVNTSDVTVEEPRVRLHLDRRSYVSRTSLDRWRTAEPTDVAGGAVAEVDLPVPLEPGASAPVAVTLPASSVGLRRGELAWGPRGLALEVVDVADPARSRLGLVRTFMLWFPVEEVTPTQVTVLVPVVGPAVSPYDSSWVDALEELTGEGGRLARVLAATEDRPEVSWVLDPWLVDVTSSGGPEAPEDGLGGRAEDAADDAAEGDGMGEGQDDGPGEAEGQDGSDAPGEDAAADDDATGDTAGPAADLPTAGPDARAWADRLLGAMTRRDVQLLPYLDPDLSALAHARAEDRLVRAEERAAEVVRSTDLPDGAATSLAWPADPLPDLRTAAFATHGDPRAVVVGPGELLPPSVLTYTPTGRTTVSTAAGDVTALVPDERLSDALRTGSLVLDDDGEPRDDDEQRTPATAAQDLLAELAVITRERPSDGRHMLVTVPRDWSPDVDVARAQLDVLDDVPWVVADPVSSLIGSPETGVDRGSLPDRALSSGEVPAAELAAMTDAVESRERLASMVEDPEALLGDTGLELLAPLSVAWRSDAAGRSELVSRAQAATAAVRESVTVQPGLTVNLISTTGGLPVRLANDLDQAVTVVVTLQPGNSRLRADEPVTATVPANGQQTIQVPVHAIQSADVDVAVEVRTPDGELVDDDTVLLVRVRADWEGIGTAAIAALLALGLVAGVVRTIRRGRRGTRGDPQLASGPDALSPEATAELAVSVPAEHATEHTTEDTTGHTTEDTTGYEVDGGASSRQGDLAGPAPGRAGGGDG